MAPLTFTIAEAARRCGCPRSTLQRAIRAGRLHLDAGHRLQAEELTSAGYLHAAGALQEHAAAAQQPRSTLETVLRDMQRTMERFTEAVDALTQELRQMQQERSSRMLQQPAPTQQPRSMERPQPAADMADTPQQPMAAPGQQQRRRPARHALPPATLQAIADERTLCEGLSLREFAQRLFDKGIYHATAKDGTSGPANPGNVKKWLDQAREAGLL